MKNNDNFRNSTLDRAKPRRHFFLSLLKRHHSDTGLVEDRTSSVTIVRIIGGLLMLHLVIIGGVLLRGHIVRGDADRSSYVGMTPPPLPVQNASVLPPPATAAATTPVTPSAPATTSTTATSSATPLAPLAATAPSSTQPTASSTGAQNHITSTAPDDMVEEVGDAPTVVNASTAVPVRHRVENGDTWQSISQQYGVSATALQEANPGAPAAAPIQGSSLVVPVASTSPTKSTVEHSASQKASTAVTAASAHLPSDASSYTVQRGETLSGIARKTRVPLKEILRINGIKDANRIKPGMQLKLR